MVSQLVVVLLFEFQVVFIVNFLEIDMVDCVIVVVCLDCLVNCIVFVFQIEDEFEFEFEFEFEVVGKCFVIMDFNVCMKFDEDVKVVVVFDIGDRIQIIDVKEDGWCQVMYKDKIWWVKFCYLFKDKFKFKLKGFFSVFCLLLFGGFGMENGFILNVVKVYCVVCVVFFLVDVYGGICGSGGNYGIGYVVDIMVSGGIGDDIVVYVWVYVVQLGVIEVIWLQWIWIIQWVGESWWFMLDCGLIIVNYYDYVYVMVC